MRVMNLFRPELTWRGYVRWAKRGLIFEPVVCVVELSSFSSTCGIHLPGYCCL